MKDQLKKWYEEHKQEVNALGITLGTVSVCVAAGVFYGQVRGKRSVSIEGLWSGENEDGSQGIRVLLTNGVEDYFFPSGAPEAA